MLQEADLLGDNAHDQADHVAVDRSAGKTGQPEGDQGNDAALAEQDERRLQAGRKRRDQLLAGLLLRLCSLIAFKEGALPLDGTVVVTLDQADCFPCAGTGMPEGSR